MRVRKKFWLLPIMLMMALFGGLIVLSQGSAVAPFIYTLFQLMIVILGISAFYHDSAASLVVDGEIVAAAQEERFTRKKHDSSYPVNAINYCLSEAGLSLAQVDHIAFYDKPFLKFERIVETCIEQAPKGYKTFIKSMPIWMREKLFLKKFLQAK